MERRQARLQVAQSRGRLPSVVGAVFDRYGVVWAGAAGDCPGVGGQYRIGSITKTMTAVLVVQARDRGLLDLDDTLGDHLGDVGYAEVTLREALSHTSGMQSEPAGPWWERHRGGDVAALLAANDGTGRVAPAGAWYHYSNLAYGLLGEVLARATGRPWRQLVADELLRPLGLTQTSYLPRPTARPGWSVDHFTGQLAPEPLTDTGAMAAAGQLWSTIPDMVLWGQFLAGSRPDVLAASSLAEMSRPVSESYGLGLRLEVASAGTMVGHTGTMPGFMAAVLVEPSSGIGGVVLTNATTGVDQVALLLDLVDGDFVDDVPDPWRPTVRLPVEAEGVPGLWFWGHSATEVRWHNDGLELRPLARPGGARFELGAGALIGVSGHHRGERLLVHRRADGSVSHLEASTFVYTSAPYGPTG